MIIAGILVAVILAAVFLFQKNTACTDVYRTFGLSPGAYTLISSDLGNAAPRKLLKGFGVAGEPDARFVTRNGRRVVIGEYKSRKFKGIVRPYEFFQTIIYMGMAKAEHNVSAVDGVIAYADGRVQIAFDQAVFDALVALRPEMLGSLKQKKPLNPKPLQKRMNVLTLNRHIKFG